MNHASLRVISNEQKENGEREKKRYTPNVRSNKEEDGWYATPTCYDACHAYRRRILLIVNVMHSADATLRITRRLDYLWRTNWRYWLLSHDSSLLLISMSSAFSHFIGYQCRHSSCPIGRSIRATRNWPTHAHKAIEYFRRRERLNVGVETKLYFRLLSFWTIAFSCIIWCSINVR